MLIPTDQIETTKDVNFLQDVKVKFVSLVRHGANREPFKIFKSDEGEIMNVIQSILLPSDITLEDLAAQEGLQWLAGAKTDRKVKHDGYVELEQVSKDDFNSLTEPQPIGKTGMSLILGAIKSEKAKGDLLEAPIHLFAVPVAQSSMSWTLSAGDLFFQQVDSFISTVDGVLGQQNYSKEDAMSAIMSGWKAFGAFLEDWSTRVFDNSENMDSAKTATKTYRENKAKADGGNTEMTGDEIKTIISESLKPISDEIAAIKNAMPKPEAPKDPIEVLTETVQNLQTQLSGMIEAEKKAKSESEKADADKAKADDHSLTSDPNAPGTPEPVVVGAVKADPLPADKRAGAFSGLIFKKS